MVKQNSGTATSGAVIKVTTTHKFTYVEQHNSFPFLGTTVIEIPMDKAVVANAQQVGKDVCVLLDLSGSMIGQKIIKARQAIRKLRDKLGIKDRLCIVGFDEKSDLDGKHLIYKWSSPKVIERREFLKDLLDLFAKPENKPTVTVALENANPNGNTAFHPAFASAREMFNRIPEITGEYRRKIIIMITDGDHNTGENPMQICQELRDDGLTICALGVEQSSRGEELLQKMLGAAYFFGIDSDKTEEAIDAVQNCFGAAVISNAKIVVDIPNDTVLENSSFSLAMIMSKNGRPFAVQMKENEISLGNLTNGTRLRVFYIGKINSNFPTGTYPIMNVTLKGYLYTNAVTETVITENKVTVKIGKSTSLHNQHELIDVLANSAIALNKFNQCKESTNLTDLKTKSGEARRTAEMHTTEFNDLLIESIKNVEKIAETNFGEAQNMSRELTTQTVFDAMQTGIILRKALGIKEPDSK